MDAKPTRIAFISLGCAKNLVDSEKMLGQLAEAGCHLTTEATEADVVVVNTCGFLAAAREEAVEAIAAAADFKETGRCRRLVVAGCLVQRDGVGLLDQVDGIDALVGVNNRNDLVRAVLEPDEQIDRTRPAVDLYLGDYYPRADDDTARLRITPRHFAYLRISEGCDQKCTFCTIPAIRGPMHSKPPEAVLAEARELAADGAVEINLIGQDTTSYGADLGYEPGLAGLLHLLDRQCEGVSWLRLMYAYPTAVTDDLLEALANSDRFVKYLDLPLQHISDRVLKAMHRRVDRRATERLLERIRTLIPGVTLRTTMIVGFPGETDAEFQELVDFVREFRFDALGVFTYSQEPDTPAARIGRQVPDQVMQERRDTLMTTQQDVAFTLADARRGQTFEVLVEGPPDGGLIPARHAGQAPEVDSLTWIETKAESPAPADALQPGRLQRVRCTGRQDYDLLAVPTQRSLRVVDPV